MERRKERRKKPGTTYQKVVEAAVQLLGDRQGEPYRQGGECYNFTFIFFFVGFLELSLRLGSALIMRTRTVTLCLIP